MTISSQNRKAGPFIGNDVTVNLPFNFKVFSAADMYVVQLEDSTQIETELDLDTDYTVTLNEDQNTDPGGSVVLALPLATGFRVVVTSKVGYLQLTDITNQGGFYPQVVTAALDRLTILCQQLKEEVALSAKLPITSAADAAALVADILRLANSADNVDTVAGSIGNVNTTAENIANVDTVAGHISNVDTVAGHIANVDTVAGINDDITQVAAIHTQTSTVSGIADDVTQVAGIHTQVGLVAANETNIDTVAGISINVSTVAGIAGDVSAVSAVDGELVQVAAIDGEVATVAGIAPSVSTVASNQTLIAALGTDLTGGPITLDYGDLGENRNPATPIGVLGAIYAIISQIVTVANNNANVTTVGTNIAGVNTAATNIAAILDAPNQAGIATTQAGIATTQAGIATSGANSAGAAQIAAEQARDQTLAAFDSFDDRYLGAKASNPTTDNDGNPLVPGALYYNTVAPEMRVWEGSMWVAAYASLSGALLKANNLSDLQSAATARTNLGLGSLAVKNSISATDLAANFDLGSIV